MNDAQGSAVDDSQRAAGVGPPPGVAERLVALRSLLTAQGLERADGRPPDADSSVSKRALSILVAARLRELRALDELARYLHRGRLLAAGSPEAGRPARPDSSG